VKLLFRRSRSCLSLSLLLFSSGLPPTPFKLRFRICDRDTRSFFSLAPFRSNLATYVCANTSLSLNQDNLRSNKSTRSLDLQLYTCMERCRLIVFGSLSPAASRCVRAGMRTEHGGVATSSNPCCFQIASSQSRYKIVRAFPFGKWVSIDSRLAKRFSY
jgi:hypothetical protein